ncbi:MAG: hypothetical protein KGI38_13100, partial [Thaumarchaeota archaeon]|nr:hypothetical protein [Nitrososphaerota archaeon]
MASEPEVAAGGWQTFQLVFMAAVLLAIASEALGIISALYIRPFVVNWLSGLMPPPSGQQAFLGNIQAESFYSSVIQNLINFVISPVLFLFVFYKLGPRIRTKLD